MRRIINILTAVVASASILCACDDPIGELKTGHEPKFIDVTEVQSDYSAFPATTTLTYSCPEAVTGSSNQAWCTVTKVSEGKFELSVSTNRSLITRNAMVSLKAAGGKFVQIPVTQRGLVCRASESTVQLSALGGSRQIELYTPIYELSSDEDWIDYSIEGNIITISLLSNPELNPRTGSIEVKVPEYDFETSIIVEQPNIVFTTSVSSATFPMSGGSRTVTVSAPVDFTHSPSHDWINYTVEGDNIMIDLGENPGTTTRIGSIDIELPEYSLKRSIVVKQSGDLRGLGMANKFIGATDTETAWYFDPYAENGVDFLNSWKYDTNNNNGYHHNYMKIGRFNVSGFVQAVRYAVYWKNNATTYSETGYKIEMTEGDTDDQIVFTLKIQINSSNTIVWPNDGFFWGLGGMSLFMNNLTGENMNDSKTYIITFADDDDDPAVMMLKEVTDDPGSTNWFTLTKTPVTL